MPYADRTSLWKKSDKPVNVWSTRRLYLNYSIVDRSCSLQHVNVLLVVGSKSCAYNERDTSQTSMRASSIQIPLTQKDPRRKVKYTRYRGQFPHNAQACAVKYSQKTSSPLSIMMSEQSTDIFIYKCGCDLYIWVYGFVEGNIDATGYLWWWYGYMVNDFMLLEFVEQLCWV